MGLGRLAQRSSVPLLLVGINLCQRSRAWEAVVSNASSRRPALPTSLSNHGAIAVHGNHQVFSADPFGAIRYHFFEQCRLVSIRILTNRGRSATASVPSAPLQYCTMDSWLLTSGSAGASGRPPVPTKDGARPSVRPLALRCVTCANRFPFPT